MEIDERYNMCKVFEDMRLEEHEAGMTEVLKFYQNCI